MDIEDDDWMTAEEVVTYVMQKSGCSREDAEEWLAEHHDKLLATVQ